MAISFLKGKKPQLHKLLLYAVEHGKPALFGLMVVALSLVGWFIFQNVYVPLTRAVELAELKESTSIVRPDKRLLENTQTLTEDRTAQFNTDWERLRNPFQAIVIEQPNVLETEKDETIDTVE